MLMNILIIEDDSGIAELMQENLVESNYLVNCVETFEAADIYLENEKPFLMIVDYSISNKNAMDWLKNRKESMHYVPPFIMSTGQGDERIAVSMMKLGARDYIIKDSHFLEMIPLVVNRVCVEIENENKLKLAEQALHESENRYKNLFEKSLSVMLLINPDTGIIKDANPAACNFYGWSYAELCGKNMCEINGLTDEENKRGMLNAKNEKHNYFVFKHQLANGEKRNVEVYSTPINFGEMIMLYSIIQDITERKQAEDALKESEEKFREMANLLPQIVFEMDLNGIITYVNDQSVAILGYKNYELIGQKSIMVHIPEERDRIVYLLQQKPIWIEVSNREYTMLRKDGTVFTALIYTNGILKDNNLVGLRGIIVDITERKKTEETLLKKMEELERFQTLTVGRELTMIGLKKEVNEMLLKIGKKEKYKIVE